MEQPIQLKVNEELQKIFIPEKHIKTEERSLHQNKYRLVIESYKRQENGWDYTCGTIYDEHNIPLFIIQRNYHSFLAVELSHDNKDYLVVGASYMHPTLLNLTDHKTIEIKNEHFCWSSCFLSPSHSFLVVSGCIWACPYEYRFFNFAPAFNDLGKIKELEIESEEYLEPGSSFHPEDPYQTGYTKIDWSILPKSGGVTKSEGQTSEDLFIYASYTRWCPKIKKEAGVYYSELGMELMDEVGKQYPDPKDQSNEFQRRFSEVDQKYLAESSEMIHEKTVTLKREGDKMVEHSVEYSTWKEEQQKLESAYTLYSAIFDDLWMKNCPLMQKYLNQVEKPEIYKRWAGSKNEISGNVLYFQHQEKKYYFQTNYEKANHDPDWVLKNFGGDKILEDVEKEIILDYQGQMFITDLKDHILEKHPLK